MVGFVITVEIGSGELLTDGTNCTRFGGRRVSSTTLSCSSVYIAEEERGVVL